MISQSIFSKVCEIDSPQSESIQNAYKLAKHIASRKVNFDSETQRIVDKLVKTKISIDISKLKELNTQK